jgi:DNA repair protein RecN (Recombination protein N)
MLKALSVKNLSIIEDIHIEFDCGLNIITGETGAGKSILVGAIKLLMGERFTKNLIRNDDKDVKIEAIFEGDFSFLDDEIKREFDIESEIVVKRIIDKSLRNKSLINGNIATLFQLKDVISEIIDIHGQNESQKLLNPKNHLFYIDSYGKSEKLEIYKKIYYRYTRLKSEVEQLRGKISEVLKNRNFMEYQINEINALEIKLPDDYELDEKISYLTNIEKINENLTLAISALRDGEVNAYSLITDATKYIGIANRYLEKLKNCEEKLTNILYSVDDISKELSEYLEFDTFDQDYLNRLNERKYRLENIQKKYNLNLEEILNLREKLKEQIENIVVDEDDLKRMENELHKMENELLSYISEINEDRKRISKEICSKIEHILSELELKDTKMDVRFQKLEKIDKNASILAEFLISTNVGFEPESLAKIASGGEISRVMLALKEVFAKVDNTGTLIFDEIDTGISGKTAKKVAEKLKNLSKDKQLIVITHLPVVAAMADNHIHISKVQTENKTKTVIEKLNKEKRKEILANMIAGEITDMSIKQAEELING